MTAQNTHDNQYDPLSTTADRHGTDPIGPVQMPNRSRVGSRALALVGSASVLTVALMAVEDCITQTTVSAPH
jgi:hypothetical protein